MDKLSATVDRVRFLVDKASGVAARLVAAGHSATHVRVLRMQGATDDEVLAHAASEHQALVTTATDLDDPRLSGAANPSVLLPRGVGDMVNERASVLIRALTVVEDDLSLRRRG